MSESTFLTALKVHVCPTCEEVDELWEDVKANRKDAALKEAVQVAAMGLRYIVNLTPKEELIEA